MTSEPRGIQSVEVGGRILTSLVEVCAPMALKDLSLAAGLTPGQCHAYLNSYRQIGLVEQDEQSGLYRLGPFALRLALGRVNNVPILKSVSQAVDRLARELGFMALMLVWGPQGPTVIQVCEGVDTFTLNIRTGTLFSVTGTASGYVFAAFDTSDKVRNLINEEFAGRQASAAIGDAPAQAEFARIVAQTRENFHAVIAGRPVPEINAISAPVLDASSQLVAVMTLVGRPGELPIHPKGGVVEKLIETAKQLSNTGISAQ